MRLPVNFLHRCVKIPLRRTNKRLNCCLAEWKPKGRQSHLHGRVLYSRLLRLAETFFNTSYLICKALTSIREAVSPKRTRRFPCFSMRTIQTTEKPTGKSPNLASSQDTSPQIPIAAIFSFLKETRGMDTWTTRDMAQTLRITTKKASAVLPFLTMQGYVREASSESEWMTTTAGATISGSSVPHFLRESVERATESLAQRMKEFNRSSDFSFEIKNAVAFGDFLRDEVRVQAADVGIHLNRKSKARAMGAVRDEHISEQALLKSLRNSSPLLHLSLYEDWMGARTHRKLI